MWRVSLNHWADTGSVTVEGEAKDEAVIAGKYPELTYAKIVLFVTAMGKVQERLADTT